MNQPLISIIMPVYNAGLFLEACLDSVINQSYDNWELIAVDDFSADDSRLILEKYTKRNTNISWLKNENKGIISALQTGYGLSKGVYISRMDADDIMPLNKLSLLINELQQVGQGYLATGKVKYFSQKELGNGFVRYADWLNAFTLHSNHFDDLYKECVIASPAWLISRRDFDLCGGFQSDVYPEDYDLVFRFYQNDIKIISTQEVIHLWRDHGARASRNDPHYIDNNFFDLKVKYFERLAYGSKSFNLIGAGKKGKELAKRFAEKDMSFDWYSNNQNKIGKDIYGLKVKDEEVLNFNKKQVIAVSNREEQNKLCLLLESKGQKRGEDYFVFV